ncbi:RagB/SusD family nutrient uptake outer membrane protein [Sunxiuqinia elliptica]|uniref:SusD family protein n=1 Tax=Sunxiuqinia elliptica TaxID=655355 RepID=A0A1I2A9M6_9BACT|nr:RagB/SusD family nutrient uptake outer membrane protein [Sunxiuqinia elliptica]SFE39703.1 SusD family protein [Sunxiuqinia elliptica]
MNINKIYFLALIASLSLALTSCEDLDTLPGGKEVTDSQKDEVVNNDPSKAEAGVNSIFAQFSVFAPNEKVFDAERHNDFGYGALMMFTDANGNDVISEDNGYNWTGNDLDYTDREHTSREVQIIWNEMYAIIDMTNSVIGANPLDVEDPTRQFYLGQGLATRSFSYWVLAQLFQFNYVGNESALCVPIVTNENSDETAINGAPRATVKEVYELIQSDIDKAIDLLTKAEGEGIARKDKRYVDLSVAYGIRARINLTMQKWSEAASDAAKAIELSSAAPASIEDVKKPAFWTVNEANWMWGIVINETDRVVTSGIVNWISHIGSLNWGYANYSGGKQINKILFESIPASDVRKGWWIDEDLTSPNLNEEQAEKMVKTGYPAFTQVKFAPYNNIVGNSTNANDIPLMRIEEMYLIKAEAEAMSGADGKSTLENFVKTYRNPDYVCQATSATDIQEEVFNQRRIELWGEGLNWFDIMRLNKGVDRRGAGYPNATTIFNIPPKDNILLWRIPEAEIQANPSLSEADNNPHASKPTPVEDI